MMKKNQNKENNEQQDEDSALQFLLNEYYDKQKKEEWSETFAEKHAIERDELPKKGKSRIIGLFGSIAASVILLIYVNTFFNPFGQSINELADRMIIETPLTIGDDLNTRGHDQTVSVEKDLQQALTNKNYQAIITIYEKEGPIAEMKMEDQFYFGVSLLKSNKGNTDKCLQLLTSVAQGDNAFSLDAKWFLALAYLINDEQSLGKTQLIELMKESNYQKTNANRLLKRLK